MPGLKMTRRERPSWLHSTVRVFPPSPEACMESPTKPWRQIEGLAHPVQSDCLADIVHDHPAGIAVCHVLLELLADCRIHCTIRVFVQRPEEFSTLHVIKMPGTRAANRREVTGRGPIEFAPLFNGRALPAPAAVQGPREFGSNARAVAGGPGANAPWCWLGLAQPIRRQGFLCLYASACARSHKVQFQMSRC